MSQNTKHGIANIRNWMIILLLVGLATVLVFSIVNASKKIRTTSRNLKVAEQEYKAMYERGQSVDQLLKNFEDDFGFEKYVRENFGVVRPGEKVVIISNTAVPHPPLLTE